MKKAIYLFLMAVLIFVVGCSSLAQTQFPQQITIFKSPTCGCCSAYTNYMEKRGFGVQVVNAPNIDAVKKQNSIPPSLQSCHTTVVGDYFVEGHIPVEAIDKLLTEKPAIAGIAMPGMPYGSPGMPGNKELFIIYAVGEDGSVSEFMRI